MKLLTTICALCVAVPCSAGTWSHETQDGVRTAKVTDGDQNEVYVLCDAGINAPITSINFVLDGTSPAPNSRIMLQFNKDEPIYVDTDTEGGLGTFTPKDARQFENVMRLMKAKTNMTVRIFTGATKTFALRGSSRAIGADCNPDLTGVQLALQ